MKKIILLLLLQFLISSCTQDNDKVNQNTNEISMLKDQITSIKEQLTITQSQIQNMRSSIYSLKNEEAVFTPSSKGYSIIHSDTGYFVVSLDNLVKYANGYKAFFSIGNPSLMTFNGVKAIVKWGKSLSKDEEFSLWYDSLKTETIDISNPLLPGVWNKVVIVLSPADAKETGFISISLVTSRIFLNADSRQFT